MREGRRKVKSFWCAKSPMSIRISCPFELPLSKQDTDDCSPYFSGTSRWNAFLHWDSLRNLLTWVECLRWWFHWRGGTLCSAPCPCEKAWSQANSERFTVTQQLATGRFSSQSSMLFQGRPDSHSAGELLNADLPIKFDLKSQCYFVCFTSCSKCWAQPSTCSIWKVEDNRIF
jgi:hypothetical protein